MNYKHFTIILLLAIIAGLVGCHDQHQNDITLQHPTTTVSLDHLSPAEVNSVLDLLELGPVFIADEPNTIILSGTGNQQQRVALALDLMDSELNYVIELLGPAAMVRSLPSNGQIARTVGNLSLGTFADPPVAGYGTRGLLDVHDGGIILIVPVDYVQKIRQVIAEGHAWVSAPPAPSETVEIAPSLPEFDIVDSEPVMEPANTEPQPVVATTDTVLPVFDPNTLPQRDPNTIRGVLKPYALSEPTTVESTTASPIELPNGEDVLELTLPEQMDLIELLDLAGEYLDLDYVYDAAKIRNQSIALRLHGKRAGQLRVKDLYTLMETALKFKGLAMVRKEGNLVSIVPVAEALDVDPTLVTPEQGQVHAGDMVVTRVFSLQYIDVASVTSLLETMKLSVAVAPIVETQTVFVTCYAHRMPRIEQLIRMVDKPGQSKEFRFRQLQYTMARNLATKVQALAAELQDVTVSVTSGSTSKKPGPPAPPVPRPKHQAEPDKPGTTVYLDTDERTNRMLMIGGARELDLVEQLIDILDVAQQDLRTMLVYAINHLEAEVAADKLASLGVLGGVAKSTKGSKAPPPTGSATESLDEQPQVTVIEATNSLLINATWEQHQRIQGILQHIDVVRQDRRRMQVYAIEKVQAQDVLDKLNELGITQSNRNKSKSVPSSGKITGPKTAAVQQDLIQEPAQVVVLESTNSLLVNGTILQHQQIAAIIELVDVEIPKEAIPYMIYFLENQSPEHLAGILEKIVTETLTDQEGKTESKIPRADEDRIIIVPDELTFSLIVYANRKHQEWIGVLIEQLDRQQSQVLIDVTLVEVSKTDEFNLDLNLITGIPDMLATSGLTEPISGSITTKNILDRLQDSGRDRFLDLQSNSGAGTGFYGDEQVMVLIKAMDEKKYGRVLAKPKVLVNDNEVGVINTKDTTYVKQTKQSALPGNTEAVITSEEYIAYEAGITLEIKPHISGGDDLLLLNIKMIRSDFIAADGEAPPDLSGSDLNTVVTVPDGSTIILGGMLKLNQTKGATKVPGLGDLPLLGGLFRGSSRSDLQKHLYIFVKAEIIRPAEAFANKEWDLHRISRENRQAFEAMEKRFQNHQLWPGMKASTTNPKQVLENR